MKLARFIAIDHYIAEVEQRLDVVVPDNIIASNAARVIAAFLRGRSPRLTEARAARLSTVRIAGCSQGLGCCLSRCAVDSTATRCRTPDHMVGHELQHGRFGHRQRQFDPVTRRVPASPIAQRDQQNRAPVQETSHGPRHHRI